METTYKVDGMSCGGCAASLTRALKAAAPDLRCEVRLDPGGVRVEGAHDPKVIEQAVTDAGFAFGGPAA